MLRYGCGVFRSEREFSEAVDSYAGDYKGSLCKDKDIFSRTEIGQGSRGRRLYCEVFVANDLGIPSSTEILLKPCSSTPFYTHMLP